MLKGRATRGMPPIKPSMTEVALRRPVAGRFAYARFL